MKNFIFILSLAVTLTLTGCQDINKQQQKPIYQLSLRDVQFQSVNDTITIINDTITIIVDSPNYNENFESQQEKSKSTEPIYLFAVGFTILLMIINLILLRPRLRK